MTWISSADTQQLHTMYGKYMFLLRILRAISPHDGFSPLEVIWETKGEYAPFTCFIGCGLVFGPDQWDDRQAITLDNIGVLEDTRRELIEMDCLHDLAELFVCRVRKKLPYDGIEKYDETKHLFAAIGA